MHRCGKSGCDVVTGIFPSVENILYICIVIKKEIMTQLIVSIEDATVLSDIKKAIRLLRGVTSVKVCKKEVCSNKTTVQAIEDAANGRTIKCGDFNGYLKLVENV